MSDHSPLSGLTPRQIDLLLIALHPVVIWDRHHDLYPQLAAVLRDWAATEAGAPYREDCALLLAVMQETDDARINEIVDTFGRVDDAPGI